MKKQKFFWLAIPALALATSFAHASTLGLETSPLGSRAGQVGYAIFDLFADASPGGPLSFTNNPTSAGGAGYIAAAAITANMVHATNPATGSGGSVTGSGERIYNGTAATSAAFNLTVSADVFSDIDSVAFQIKYTLGDAAVMNLSNYRNFFTVTLNGVAATPTEVVAPTSGNGLEVVGNPPTAQPFGVVKWTWNDLGLEAGDDITVSITSAANGHVSVDSLALDATPVPEPHEYAIGIAALLIGLVVLRRRRLAVVR